MASQEDELGDSQMIDASQDENNNKNNKRKSKKRSKKSKNPKKRAKKNSQPIDLDLKTKRSPKRNSWALTDAIPDLDLDDVDFNDDYTQVILPKAKPIDAPPEFVLFDADEREEEVGSLRATVDAANAKLPQVYNALKKKNKWSDKETMQKLAALVLTANQVTRSIISNPLQISGAIQSGLIGIKGCINLIDKFMDADSLVLKWFKKCVVADFLKLNNKEVTALDIVRFSEEYWNEGLKPEFQVLYKGLELADKNELHSLSICKLNVYSMTREVYNSLEVVKKIFDWTIERQMQNLFAKYKDDGDDRPLDKKIAALKAAKKVLSFTHSPASRNSKSLLDFLMPHIFTDRGKGFDNKVNKLLLDVTETYLPAHLRYFSESILKCDWQMMEEYVDFSNFIGFEN